MQLTRFTDYALRVLIYLGLRPNEWVTIREISDAYGISRNHLMKVVSFLAAQGYVASQRGPGGGIQLNLPPEEIKLSSVIVDAEGDMDLVECFGKGSSCAVAPACRLQGMLRSALRAFLEALEQHSLADVLQPRKELRRLLGISNTEVISST